MGMYTEIFVNVDLKPGTPGEVIDALKAMCGQGDEVVLATKPKRWSRLFNNGSFYHPLTCCANLTFNSIRGAYSLLGKGDIKNYENEIEQFFTWLIPHVDAQPGAFIGYHRYEQDLIPTLVLMPEEA